MTAIFRNKSDCPMCKVLLKKECSVAYPDMEYDRYVCPQCRVKFVLNWHRLGEPSDRPIAAQAADAACVA